MKIFIKTLGALLLLICFALEHAYANESQNIILQKLEAIGQNIVQSAARSIMPSKAKKAVHMHGRGYVASYVEIDVNSLKVEMRPGESAGHYVGLIKYAEYFYQCQGVTQQAALNAPCMQVRSRRLTEIISYDGKWHH